ncbi:MAG: hypothetical protein RIT45_3048 [Pseudomonadota bacterium]
MKGSIAIVCFVLAAGVMGWWAASGQHAATRFEIPVETIEKDDFGDEVKTVTWKKGFELGLLDGAAPAAGGLVGLGVILLLLDRKKRG